MAEGPASPVVSVCDSEPSLGSPQLPGPGKKRKPSYLTVNVKKQRTWSPKSTDILLKMVKGVKSPVNWKTVGQLMARSAKSCKAAYKRKKSITMVDNCSQTDLTITPSGNLQYSGVTSLRNFLEENDSGTAVGVDHEYCQQKALTSLLEETKSRKIHSSEKLALQLRLQSSDTLSNLAENLVEHDIVEDILHCTAKKLSLVTATLRKKSGTTSVLMCKSYENLGTINFEHIIAEFLAKFPELLKLLLAVMIPPSNWHDEKVIQQAMPRLATIYGLVMQYNCHELSLLQRSVSVCLADSICEQKIYDRLNQLGVCLSYARTLHVLTEIGGHFNDKLIDAISQKKKFRFIGDNLNFAVGVHQETTTNHKHLVHMFASAAIVSEKTFLHIENEPEIQIVDLKPDNIVLSVNEYEIIKQEAKHFIHEVAKQYLPQLGIETLDKIKYPDSICHESKTEVIPLPVLPCNESSYADVVKILDYYKQILSEIMPDTNESVQVGGDQLTRERFSGAKNLRLGNDFPHNFEQLQPVTFEFFHLSMNFLEKAILGSLYKDASTEIGTLKCEIERLLKKDFNTDVMKAYEPDLEVITSFVHAYIIEALREHLKLEDDTDCPCPPANGIDVMDKFIDHYIFPEWSNEPNDESISIAENEIETIPLEMEDGSVIVIPCPTRTETVQIMKPDFVKNYAHRTLELGCIFLIFINILKSPSREALLAVTKMMMLLLWGKNTRAKYPLEIFRMLVQQYCLLSKRQAHQTLNLCFVNTKGKTDTHIPADLQMEWIVKEQKKHIKHMYSNKTSEHIYRRSACLPGISVVAANFDKCSGTIVRAKRHKKDPQIDDVRKIADDLRTLRPFDHREGRGFRGFESISKSGLENVDWLKFGAWFERHKNRFQV